MGPSLSLPIYIIHVICASHANCAFSFSNKYDLCSLNTATFVIYMMITKIMNITENTMSKPIVSIDQMTANIQRYNEGLATVAERMPYARAWYALRTGKGWLFGPSKFIGYQDLSTKTYIERDKEKMPLDGRVTESILQRWADLVENGDPRHNELHTALNELCARFG